MFHCTSALPDCNEAAAVIYQQPFRHHGATSKKPDGLLATWAQVDLYQTKIHESALCVD